MTAIRAAAPAPSWGRLRSPLPAFAAPAVFGLSLTLFAVLSCVVRVAPFHPFGIVAFFDLKVYRASAGVVLHGQPLYSVRFPGNLAFTYPPLAALALLPLRLLPVAADEVLVTALNAGLLVVIAWWALGLARGRGAAPLPAVRRRQLAFLAAALGLWCEPVNSAIGYGQVDVVIAALIVFDLARRPGAAGQGIAIGLAAGLKLTPLIFIVYLLVSGRRRAAATATVTFVLTIAAGALLLPGDSLHYWAGAFMDTSRVSGRHHAGGGPANQSLRGALLRALPGLPHETIAWMVLAALVACLGIALAARAARRGDQALGFMLCAVTGLLVSPISWTHQWTLAMPGLLLFVVAQPTRFRRGCALAAALAFSACSYGIWIVIAEHPLGMYLDPGRELVANLYVIAGLATLLVVAGRELAARRRPLPEPAPAAVQAPG